MKRIVLIVACLLAFAQAFSQEKIITLNTLNLDTRADFTYENYLGRDSVAHGFAGKYLRFRLDGNITDRFYISAGKQVVAIGGWEYDADPIDIYYGTDFWNHVCCYEMGFSLNFLDKSKKNHFLVQMTNSPFISSAMESIYSYNLMWYGDFNVFKTAYSVNMIEYKPGSFINYISLVN